MDPDRCFVTFDLMRLRGAVTGFAYAILLGVINCSTSGAELSAEKSSMPTSAEQTARRELVVALFEWIDATNRRDFVGQSRFYPDSMDAFYLWRNVPRSAVLAEKRRVFARASTIDIGSDAPQLIIEPGARSGRMYFRKRYVIAGTARDRTGEVLQELRWVKQADGWKIVSERDLRVIRQARR